MSALKDYFATVVLLQTVTAAVIAVLLSKEGAYISMGILFALIFLTLMISCMVFWTSNLKYIYMYLGTASLWLILLIFLFLDIFGMFHILQSMDQLIIGKSGINNYKNNSFKIPSFSFILYILLIIMIITTLVLAFFLKLKTPIKQSDEYGNVFRSSKAVSVYDQTMKRTRFASEVITIEEGNNNENNMDGDPGIQVIPNNNYFNSLNQKRESKKKNVNYNNYDLIPNDSTPFLNNRPKKENDVDFDTMRKVKMRQMDDSIFSNPPKYNTLSTGVRQEPRKSIFSYYNDPNKSNTWDRSVSSKKGQETRDNNDKTRNRERIRERERERMRERNGRRDRDRAHDRERTYDKDRNNRDDESPRSRNNRDDDSPRSRNNRDDDSPRSRNNRDKERNNYDEDSPRSRSNREKERNYEGDTTNITTKEELESYLNKSSMSMYDPKFVSMFEIEENASDASEDDFTMNHFTIKCKICKKDIPINEVEHHQCESSNIPLINIETEEHKKAKEEKERLEREKEEKERLEREKEEKERLEKEEKEKEEEENKRATRERERNRRQRERERERERGEKSRERSKDRRRDDRSRDRRRGDERSRDRRRDERSRDRDHDRDRDRRRRDKDAEWEQRYNNKDDRKHRDRERDRDQRRKRKDEDIREGNRYEIIKEYEQVLNDEVTVKFGNIFEVEKIFEDGWCVGTNLSTSKWGAIPMNCLISRQEKSRRIQSLYMC